MPAPRILIVDDEPSLRFLLSDRLSAAGYEVSWEEDGNLGLDRAISGRFDLVILDGMLPGRDGYEVVQSIRERGVRTPVLMLSARGQVLDRVVGLKLGADDYLMKPFDVSELLARVEALLRRVTPGGVETFRFGEVTVNVRRAEVTRNHRTVALTPREFALLVYFIEHQGEALSRDELLNQVWGYDAMPSTRTVDVHVALLRQKLEVQPRRPRHLLTVFGRGYKFVV